MNKSLSFFTPRQFADWTQVRGWLLPEAAEALHRHALISPLNGAFVEIGSFAGKSTVCLLTAFQSRDDLPTNQPFTAIDLRFQPDFWENIGRFGYHKSVHRIAGPSLDAVEYWETNIGFLYIDGHHGKGYALADLVVWDPHLLPGAILALDDTAGFMVGPNLQIQAAVRSGAYELLDEVGGISFLRKNHSLLPIGEAPFDPGSLMAKIHLISANVGAFDPEFRLPRLPHQPMPPSEWIDRALHSSIAELIQIAQRKSRQFLGANRSKSSDSTTSELAFTLPPMLRLPEQQLEGLRNNGALPSSLAHTLDYLHGCFLTRSRDLESAATVFTTLSELTADEVFHHYDLPIHSIAGLRLGQTLDLAGKRDSAVAAYQRVLLATTVPEVRDVAEQALNNRFEIKDVAENLLLRQYNLVLYRYKRSVLGAYESIKP